jgi:hypothetical protein
VLIATLGLAGGTSAAGVTGTLALDPATAQVDNGGTVTINVVATTSVATSGVSASIKFDPAVLQITSITRAPAWASAPLFLAADAAAIATANKKGYLRNAAVSFFPPTSVPAGAQQFITVVFKAIACGTVTMTVPTGAADAQMLDGRKATYGAIVALTTTGATVTVCQGGAGSQAPGASGGASPGPSDSGNPGASASADPNASAGTTPAPSGSSQPNASASASAPPDASAGGTTSEQSGWLTFAIAALAIAAAGLAALILVLTIVAIVGAVVGGAFLFRNWRRFFGTDARPADGAAAGGDAAPLTGTTADGSTASGSTTTGTTSSGATPSGPTAATEAPAATAAEPAAPPPARQP